MAAFFSAASLMDILYFKKGHLGTTKAAHTRFPAGGSFYTHTTTSSRKVRARTMDRYESRVIDGYLWKGVTLCVAILLRLWKVSTSMDLQIGWIHIPLGEETYHVSRCRQCKLHMLTWFKIRHILLLDHLQCMRGLVWCTKWRCRKRARIPMTCALLWFTYDI